MKVTTLVGWHMGVVKDRELDESADGNADIVETWTLVFTDYQTKDQIQIAFRRDSRDSLVRQLTDGIVLGGGKLPDLGDLR